MRTLEDYMDEHAQEQGYQFWDELETNSYSVDDINGDWKIVAERYRNNALQEAEKYKENLLDRTFSMEKTGEMLFEKDSDFEKGNRMALQNFRVHIKKLFPESLQTKDL